MLAHLKICFVERTINSQRLEDASAQKKARKLLPRTPHDIMWSTNSPETTDTEVIWRFSKKWLAQQGYILRMEVIADMGRF